MATPTNTGKIKYDRGGEERQMWMRKNHFSPRGIGFLEPGGTPADHPDMSAYNIAKSAYQIRPDVLNLAWLSKQTGIKIEEIKKRLLRMYNEHLIMLVRNSSTQVNGWGIYYWTVKLRPGTSPEVKKELSSWYQNKDEICSGYETEGDFDFLNGNHMRVLDNLLWGVMMPWANRPEIESIHLCPVRRDIREDYMNMWDTVEEDCRKYTLGGAEAQRLAAVQDKLDATDIKIITTLNQKRTVEEYFDFDVLAEISGLDAETMRKGIKPVIETKISMVPLMFLNWQKLGLNQHCFMVRLFQNVPSYRKAEIADEFAATPEFNTILEFTDAHYDIELYAFKQTNDIAAMRAKLQSYSEVEKIDEADITRQYRRWTCRLDDVNNYWEECIYTDDFLQDFATRKEA